MMNSTHGPSGSLAGLIVVTGTQTAGWTPDTPVSLAFVAAATAGALLPDLDHHSSSPARVWGPITSIPCGWLGRAAGGHREGTHDISRGAPLLFALVFGAALITPLITVGPHWADVATQLAGMTAVALITGLVLVALAELLPGRWQTEPVLNFAASWLVATAVHHAHPGVLPWPVIAAATAGIALGVLTGIAGDGCTISGIPWRRRRPVPAGAPARQVDRWGRDNVHLLPAGWRIRTGSAVEVRLVRVPILVGIVLASVHLLVS